MSLAIMSLGIYLNKNLHLQLMFFPQFSVGMSVANIKRRISNKWLPIIIRTYPKKKTFYNWLHIS